MRWAVVAITNIHVQRKAAKSPTPTPTLSAILKLMVTRVEQNAKLLMAIIAFKRLSVFGGGAL